MYVLGASATNEKHSSEYTAVGAMSGAYNKTQTFDFASSSHTHPFSGSGTTTINGMSGTVSVSGTTGSPS